MSSRVLLATELNDFGENFNVFGSVAKLKIPFPVGFYGYTDIFKAYCCGIVDGAYVSIKVVRFDGDVSSIAGELSDFVDFLVGLISSGWYFAEDVSYNPLQGVVIPVFVSNTDISGAFLEFVAGATVNDRPVEDILLLILNKLVVNEATKLREVFNKVYSVKFPEFLTYLEGKNFADDLGMVGVVDNKDILVDGFSEDEYGRLSYVGKPQNDITVYELLNKYGDSFGLSLLFVDGFTAFAVESESIFLIDPSEGESGLLWQLANQHVIHRKSVLSKYISWCSREMRYSYFPTGVGVVRPIEAVNISAGVPE